MPVHATSLRSRALSWLARHETLVSGLLIGITLIAGLVLLDALPVDRGMQLLRSDVRQLGWLGLSAFATAFTLLTIYLWRRIRMRRLEQPDMHNDQRTIASRSPTWRLWALTGVTVIAVMLASFRSAIADVILALFGPPAVTMAETHAEDGSATFDHSTLDALLKTHVDEEGFVDYVALAGEHDQLNAYLKSLETAPFDDLSRDGKLAFLLNAYNAMMLDLVLDEWPVKDIIADIDQPFDKKRWKLAGAEVSLNDIEHERVRKNFKEPRIHWALVCGAFSCPKLRNEAFTADKLEDQLADQAEYVHRHPRYIAYDPNTGGDTIKLTSLYNWYGGDFEQASGSVLKHVAQYRPELQKRLDAENPPKIEFLDYSWLVNDISNRDKLEELGKQR